MNGKADMDRKIGEVIREHLDTEELVSIDGYVLIAAVTFLEEDESRILSFVTDNQRSWQTLGLLDTALVFERQLNINTYNEVE